LHALKDPEFATKFGALVSSGVPVLITDGLARALPNKLGRVRPGVQVLRVNGDPRMLLQMGEAELGALRTPLLAPLKIAFRAPNRVALSLFADGSVVVQNFNDVPVTVELGSGQESVPARGWLARWK
jgi:hypothetical protein